MYRPEDWGEIKKDAIGHAPPESSLAFEAGADAILEGLELLIREIAPSSKLVDILYPKERE